VLEYLAVALVIFVPVAVVGSKWLQKRGLSPRAIGLLLMVALVLVGLFPVLASNLNPFAFAGLHVVIFAGAGLLIWTWGKPQLAASDQAGQSSYLESCEAMSEELGLVEEGAPNGGRATSEVESEEHAIVIETEPEEESPPVLVVPDSAAGIGNVIEELGILASEVEPVTEGEAGASGEAEISAPDKEAELLGGEGPELRQHLAVPLEGPERQTAGEDGLIGEGVLDSIELPGPVGTGAEDEGPQPDTPAVEEPPAETGAAIENLIDRGFRAKSEGDYGEAASSFFAAWKVSTQPELHFMLGMELVTLYRETGDYSKALEVLDALAQNGAIGEARSETAFREKKLLEITKRLLQEIGMPDLPASQIPRLIRRRAWEEFISAYHNK